MCIYIYVAIVCQARSAFPLCSELLLVLARDNCVNLLAENHFSRIEVEACLDT